MIWKHRAWIYGITCDRCGEDETLSDGAADEPITKSKIAKFAREHFGYKEIKGEWYCPICLAKGASDD